MHSLYSLILLSTASLVVGQNTYYTELGCFPPGTGPTPAIPSNEGKGYSELDRTPNIRADPVQKCFELALRLGHNIFAINQGACLSNMDTVPGGSYAQYGQDRICYSYNNRVYQINPSLLRQSDSRFFNLGCFNDNAANTSLISNEGKGYPELPGSPLNRTNATDKCYQVAARLKHTVFAVQNGACYSSNPVPLGSFARYGSPLSCPTSGGGADLINNVYILNVSSSISSLGCWNDGPTGGFEGVRFLANISSSIADPISYCASIALSRVGPNVNLFALQTVPGNSSILKCSAQRDIVPNGSYSTYGAATTCPLKGTGAPGVNHVYQFKDSPKLEFNWDKIDYQKIGCYRARSVTRYQTRNAALSIDDCYQKAIKQVQPLFFVNAFDCWMGKDFVPGGNYATLGPATFCRYDGIGDSTNDMDTHQVYIVKKAAPKSLNLWDLPRMGNRTFFPFSSIGCVSTARNLINSLYRIVTGVSTANDCYNEALKMKHNLFGMILPATCVTSLDFIPGGNYSSQPSSDCPSHMMTSGAFSNPSVVTTQLFQVNAVPPNPDLYTKSSNWSHLRCVTFSSYANISINEGNFAILDGDYRKRIDAIQKCYQVAKQLNHVEFALEQGGRCLSSTGTYFSSGTPSLSCLNDQLGGPYFTSVANVFRVLQ